MTEHKGLPVAGYRPQDGYNVAMVNEHKQMEERLLRRIDFLHTPQKSALGPDGEMVWVPHYDPRWLALARTHIEQGFMALNRAVFQPERVKLPEDAA